MALKSTTDPFWSGDPYDHSGYSGQTPAQFGVGDAFGSGEDSGISCTALTGLENALPVDWGPQKDPHALGEPYDVDNYVGYTPKLFGIGVMFGYGVSSAAAAVDLLVAFADFLGFSKNAGDTLNSNTPADATVPMIADQSPDLGDSRLMRCGRAVDPQGVGYGVVDNSDGRFDPGAQDFTVKISSSPSGTGNRSILDNRQATDVLVVRMNNTTISLLTFNAGTKTASATISPQQSEFEIRKSGTVVQMFQDGVELSVTGDAYAALADSAGSTHIGILGSAGGGEVYIGKTSEVQFIVAGTVVGHWATGAEEAGSECPSLVAGGPDISWVNKPAGFFIEDPAVKWSPSDDYGYKKGHANLDWDPSSGIWEARTGPTPQVVRALATATRVNELGIVETVAANTGRIDYDPVTLDCLGALIEPSAVQSVGYTDFSSGWFHNKGTFESGVSDDFMGQPVNLYTTNASYAIFSYNVSTSDGVTYVGSYWVRRLSGGGNTQMYHEDSASGNTGTIYLSSEWKLVQRTFLGRSGGGTIKFGIRIDGTAPVVIEISMPQVEVGTVATSFIPNTTGSPVTRNADVVSIGGDEFTSMWNAVEGSVYAEAAGRVVSNSYGIYAFESSGTQKITSVFSGERHMRVYAGSEQANMDAGICVAGQVNRVSGSWKASNFQCALDGVGATPDVSGSVPVCDTLSIGSNLGANLLNGHISRLVYWPLHSTDAAMDVDLAVLTAAGTYEATLDSLETAIVPAAADGLLTANGHALDYAGRAPRDLEIHRRVLTLDGSTNHVSVLDSVAGGHDFTALDDAITLCAWINPSTVTAAAPVIWRGDDVLLELRVEAGDSTVHIPFSLGIANSSLLVGFTDNYTTGAEIVEGVTDLLANEWIHVAVTIDGNDVVIYINGIEDVSATLATATGDRSVGSLMSNLTLGCRSLDAGTVANYFPGEIADVRIYDSVLTPAQIANYANLPTGAVMHLPLEGDYLDVSGNNNHGEIVNATGGEWTGDRTDEIASFGWANGGVRERYLDLPGTVDHAEMANPGGYSIPVGDDFEFSSIVNLNSVGNEGFCGLYSPWIFIRVTSGQLQIIGSGGSNLTSSGSIPTGEWIEVKMSRTSGVFYCGYRPEGGEWVNLGVSAATFSGKTTGSSSPLPIGSYNGDDAPMDGKMKRITLVCPTGTSFDIDFTTPDIGETSFVSVGGDVVTVDSAEIVETVRLPAIVPVERTVLTLGGTNRIVSPASNVGTSESFSIWVKTTDALGSLLGSAGNSGHFGLLWAIGNGSTTQQYCVYLSLTVNGAPIAAVDPLNPTRDELYLAVANGEWNFIEATINFNNASWDSGIYIGGWSTGAWTVVGQFANAKLDGHFLYKLDGDVLDSSGEGNDGSIVSPTGSEWNNTVVDHRILGILEAVNVPAYSREILEEVDAGVAFQCATAGHDYDPDSSTDLFDASMNPAVIDADAWPFNDALQNMLGTHKTSPFPWIGLKVADASKFAMITVPNTDVTHWWDLDNVTTGLNDLASKVGGWTLTNNSASNSSGTGPGSRDVIDMSATQYLDRANSAWDGANGSSCTFQIWANMDAISSLGNWLWSWRDTAAGTVVTQYSFYKTPTPDTFASFMNDTDGDEIDASWSSAPSTSTWYHCVATFDGTTLKNYVDGVLRQSATNASYGGIITSSQPFALGTSSWNKGSSTLGHDGKLALCGIWDIELTAEQVAWLYNSGSGRAYADLE